MSPAVGYRPRTPRRRAARSGIAALCAALLAAAAACVPPGPDVGGGPAGLPPGPGDELVPAGYGSLRQDDFTISLRSGEVRVQVTPLAEWVIRLAAPDTYRRLTGALERVDPAERAGRLPVLVSFYTEAAGGAEIEVRDLTLRNRGRAFRPESMHGLSSDWGSGRLRQREPQQAIYLFDAAVDLEMELDVELGDVRSSEWSLILPRLETERARVRARARGG